MSLTGLSKTLLDLSIQQRFSFNVFEAVDQGVFDIVGGNPTRLSIVFWTDKSNRLSVRPACDDSTAPCWDAPNGQTFLAFRAADLPGIISLPWVGDFAKNQKIYWIESNPA